MGRRKETSMGSITYVNGLDVWKAFQSLYNALGHMYNMKITLTDVIDKETGEHIPRGYRIKPDQKQITERKD